MAPKLRQPGIFGQLNWDTYTVIVLGFEDQPGTSRDDVLTTLDSSALRLLEAYPFLAGQVVKNGQSATNSGRYEIVPYAPHHGKTPVRRKDCSKLCPSYQELLRADAPFAMLDGEILCPMKGLGYQYESSTELPVLVIQANFVDGGLLLCFASMHNALDMNGQGVLLQMFATAGRGEELDPALVEAGNRDADTIVPLLKPGEPSASHGSMLRPSQLNKAAGNSDSRPRPAAWTYWRFPADKLVELKKQASSGKTWVSTNDAITAFLFQRLTAARVAGGLLSPGEPVNLQRPVDSRTVLDPPVQPGYMGHLVALADTKWPTAKELIDSSLADASVAVRESLKRVDDHFVRSLVTLIYKTEDKSTIFYGSGNKPARDAMVSSWAQLHWLMECDFGRGLGAPHFVRRARLAPVPDLSYIMPKNREGNVLLASCLFHEDTVALANDDIWRKFTKYVG